MTSTTTAYGDCIKKASSATRLHTEQAKRKERERVGMINLLCSFLINYMQQSSFDSRAAEKEETGINVFN